MCVCFEVKNISLTKGVWMHAYVPSNLLKCFKSFLIPLVYKIFSK